MRGDMDKRKVKAAVRVLMDALDLPNDHNTEDTPDRVTRMYCDEVMRGLYEPMPKLTTFPNVSDLDELVCSGPISIRSMCSHHLVPVLGHAYIGIIPGDKLIGLSKFNRLAQWVFAKPCMQEEATQELANILAAELRPRGLGVVVQAQHFCLKWRGVKDDGHMATSVLRGIIKEAPQARAEFFQFVGNNHV